MATSGPRLQPDDIKPEAQHRLDAPIRGGTDHRSGAFLEAFLVLICVTLAHLVEKYQHEIWYFLAFIVAVGVIRWWKEIRFPLWGLLMLCGVFMITPYFLRGEFLRFREPLYAWILSYFPLTVLLSIFGLATLRKGNQSFRQFLSPYAALHVGISLVACIGAVGLIPHLSELPLTDRPPMDCAAKDESKVRLTLQSTDAAKQPLVLPLAFNYLNTNNVCKDQENTLFVYRGLSTAWTSAIRVMGVNDSRNENICGVGMDSLKISNHPVMRMRTDLIGLSAIAFIVNAKRHVPSLKIDEMRQIFSGRERRWSKFGSEEGTINIFVPSATYETRNELNVIRDILLKEDEFAHDVRICAEDINDCIAQDENSIGFVDVAQVHNGKVRTVSVMDAMPSPEDMKDGKYPVLWGIYIYHPIDQNSSCNSFYDFASSKGQSIFRDRGFIAQAELPPKPPLLELDGSYGDYLKIKAGGILAETIFPFPEGKPDLTDDAMDRLKAVAAKLQADPEYKDRPVLLAGHADKRKGENGTLSGNRAIMVSEALKRYGIRVLTLSGFGTLFAKASEDNPSEREKDRRVEIWVWSGKPKSKSLP